MAEPRRLRWGLLSTARINRSIIEPICASKKSILSAVASRSLDKAKDYAKSWDIPRCYGDYDALLNDPEIDVIYNSLPNTLHAEWSIKQCDMESTCCAKTHDYQHNRYGFHHRSGYRNWNGDYRAFMYRHHPQTLLVKQLIDKGEIGTLQLIRIILLYHLHA
jgi:predicted dehydrogenase